MEQRDVYLVYVVDDDHNYVEQLKQHLHKAISGFLRVRSFATAEECIAHSDKKPHLILLENCPVQRIPGKGLSLLRKIKGAFEDIPVVVLTRNNNFGSVIRNMRNGAYSYILKNREEYLHIDKTIRKVIAKANDERRERWAQTRKLERLMIVVLLMLVTAIILYFAL